MTPPPPSCLPLLHPQKHTHTHLHTLSHTCTSLGGDPLKKSITLLLARGKAPPPSSFLYANKRHQNQIFLFSRGYVRSSSLNAMIHSLFFRSIVLSLISFISYISQYLLWRLVDWWILLVISYVPSSCVLFRTFEEDCILKNRINSNLSLCNYGCIYL